MKGLLDFYKASNNNKFVIILILFLVYMLLFIAANPHVYDPAASKIKFLIDQTFSQRTVQKPVSLVVTPVPTLTPAQK